jgi:hypothetical protein
MGDAGIDPTLGELEQAGELSAVEVLQFGRLFGGSWRTVRLSEARASLAQIEEKKTQAP